MKSDLENLYKGCQAPVENIPLDITTLLPGEEISLDFAEICGNNVLVNKDNMSHHLFAEFCRDKTTNSVEKVLSSYFNLFGLPYRIVTNGGPCFHNFFWNFEGPPHCASPHISLEVILKWICGAQCGDDRLCPGEERLI